MSQSTLQPLFTRFVEKLRTLLLPLDPAAAATELGGCPLPAEVCAAEALLVWMLDYLDQLSSRVDDDPMAWRMLLPNVKEFNTFIYSLTALPDPLMPCPEPSATQSAQEMPCPEPSASQSAQKMACPEPSATQSAQTMARQEPLTSDCDPTMARQEAPACDFASKKAFLIQRLDALLPYTAGYKRPDNVATTHFLPTLNQRLAYKGYVLAYYHEHMQDGQGKHKDDMLHWAAIYQAIVDRGGAVLPKGVAKLDAPFYGPEFDHFVYDFCGIRYNTSANARGRYRRVDEVRKACLHPDALSPKALSPAQIRLFNTYRSLMSELISSLDTSRSSHSGRIDSRRLYGSSDVPKRLEEA